MLLGYTVVLNSRTVSAYSSILVSAVNNPPAVPGTYLSSGDFHPRDLVRDVYMSVE